MIDFENKAYLQFGMKKDFAIAQLQGVKALAELLGIRRQAIYQWDDEVPKLRALELQDLRPDLFPRPRPRKSKRSAAAANQTSGS